MIQRIQSVYLAIVLVLLTILSFGVSFFNFYAGELSFRLNAMGVQQLDTTSGKEIQLLSIPFFIGIIVLMLLVIGTIFNFKNLKRQLTFARLTALVYFICLIFVCFGAFLGKYFTNQEEVQLSMGAGFFLVLIGFPLVLLAVRAINKDKKLIDSVNRLR